MTRSFTTTLLVAFLVVSALGCASKASSGAGTGGSPGSATGGISGTGGIAGIGGNTGSGGAAGSTGSAGRGGTGAVGGATVTGGTGGPSGPDGGGAIGGGSGGRDASVGTDADTSSLRDAGTDAADAQNLRAVIVIAGSGVPSPGDNVMIGRLVAHGFRVTPIGDATVRATDVTGMDLVVISSSAESGPLGTKIRDVPVPMVCAENGEYPFMNMTGTILSTDFGMTTIQSQVRIGTTGDPLAGGLTGVVTIASQASDLGWAVPGPAAVRVASQLDNAAHVVLFGYARGDQMVGLSAPARRVGFAIRETLAANLSPNGIVLFDAAIEWALRP